MGTKKVSTAILQALIEGPKSLDRVKKSLASSGLGFSENEIGKSLSILESRGYISVSVQTYSLTEQQLAASDINQDGVLNILDLVILIDAILQVN